MTDALRSASATLTCWYEDAVWFPFIEDENANIAGPGHQDKTAFTAVVHSYDKHASGNPAVERHEESEAKHEWAILDAEAEKYRIVDAETPGAVPITTIRGVR
ncbi:MAG: hypothetical protein L0H59_08880 [Tomitella sp.]|nr:hypothetical protein [Tomitella sp.]